jgi:hypothetical protein
MYKGFKLAALAGALSIAMGGSAFAASTDLKFDGWTMDANGTVSQGSICGHSVTHGTLTSNFTCSDVIADDPNDPNNRVKGFRQTTVTESITDASDGSVSKDTYLMTIVADESGNGDTFSDVSFIRMGDTTAGTNSNASNINGIMGMQSLNSQNGTFKSDTSLRSGWGITDVGAPVASIDIKQSLFDEGADNTTTADNFNSSFMFQSFSENEFAEPLGFTMSIDQATGLGLNTQGETDLQVFALREKQGSQLPAAPATPIDLAANIGVTNDPVTWTETTGPTADSIKSIWMGQKVDLQTMGESTFGYVSYENTGTGAKASQYSLDNTLDTSDWDEATGEAVPAYSMPLPCAADPSGFNCP